MFRRTGSSFDLKNIREYQFSDDPRRIDWKLEGRTGRLYVKEYYDEEREGAALLVDLSGSLGVFGALDARRVGATLAYLISALGLSVSLAVFDTATRRRLALRRGGAVPSAIATFFSDLAPEGRTDIRAALAEARAASRHRRLVLVSDFFDRGFQPALSPFSRNFFVWLYRPLEDLGPGNGEIEVEDPETMSRLHLPWDEAAKAAYRRREAELAARFRDAERAGAFYARVQPETPKRGLYWSFLEALYA